MPITETQAANMPAEMLAILQRIEERGAGREEGLEVGTDLIPLTFCSETMTLIAAAAAAMLGSEEDLHLVLTNAAQTHEAICRLLSGGEEFSEARFRQIAIEVAVMTLATAMEVGIKVPVRSPDSAGEVWHTPAPELLLRKVRFQAQFTQMMQAMPAEGQDEEISTHDA